MILIEEALILIPLYYKWNTFFMLDLLLNRNNSLSHRQIDQQNCFQQSHGLPVEVSPAWTRWLSVFLKKTYYYSCLSVRPAVRRFIWEQSRQAAEHVVCRLTSALEALWWCVSALWSSEDTSWLPVWTLDVPGCGTWKSEHSQRTQSVKTLGGSSSRDMLMIKVIESK